MIKAKLTDSVSISEIMTLREQGLSVKEIAKRLDVSEMTIRRYIGPTKKNARHTIITPELKQRMFDLREQGLSNREIAETLHITPVTVRNYIGKETSGKSGRKSKVDPQELQRLRAQGLSQKQIAERLNISQKTVSNHLQRLALSTPSTSPQPTPPDPVTPPSPEPRVVSKITDKTVREILDLNEKGMSLRKISDQVGINHHQVKSIIKKHSAKAAPSTEPKAQLRPAPSFRDRLNEVIAEQSAPPRPALDIEPEPDPILDEPFDLPTYSRTPAVPPYSHKWHEVETVYRLIGCSACYLANVTAQKVTVTDRKEQLIGRFTRSELVQYISELERVLWVLDGQQEGKEPQ